MLNIPYQNPGSKEVVSICSSISFLCLFLQIDKENTYPLCKRDCYWLTNVYTDCKYQRGSHLEVALVIAGWEDNSLQAFLSRTEFQLPTEVTGLIT